MSVKFSTAISEAASGWTRWFSPDWPDRKYHTDTIEALGKFNLEVIAAARGTGWRKTWSIRDVE